MDFIELCEERYSLRKFSGKEVEDEKLEKVLEAGRLAPTAHNFQPQKFYVLRSQEALAKIDKCTGCHFDPAVMIVALCDKSVAWNRETDGKNHGEIDTALAVSQMMLEAASLGLGTTFVGMFEPDKILEEFPQMKGLTPVALVPLGYPAEGAHPSRLHTDRKPLDEMVNYL